MSGDPQGGGGKRGGAPGAGDVDDDLELDDSLIDALYGERTDRGDERPRRRVREADEGAEGDAGQELAQLRQLRGMFAELRADQEEPPPAGMALLMAAARQAADERKVSQRQEESAGLWARLRAGWLALVAHPGMAAALAAVVVVGASGYLMSRGVKTAESTYTDSAESSSVQSGASAPRGSTGAAEQGNSPAPAAEPAPMSAPAGDSPAEPAAMPMAPTPMAPMATAPIQAPGEGLGQAPGEGLGQASGEVIKGAGKKDAPSGGRLGGAQDVEQERRPIKGKQSRPATSSAREAPDDLLSAGAAADSDGRARTVDRREADDFASKQNSDAAAGAKPPRPVQAPAAPPPPPPPSPRPTAAAEEEASESSALDEGDSEAPPAKPAKVESVAQKSERWYVLAREAAAKGDCGAVRVLAARVKGEDPSFYEKKFRKDASLQKCM